MSSHPIENRISESVIPIFNFVSLDTEACNAGLMNNVHDPWQEGNTAGEKADAFAISNARMKTAVADAFLRKPKGRFMVEKKVLAN